MATNNTRQAAWVALGSFCSFGIGIVSSMILSRYFNKADYGTYKQVLYVYHTLLTVFTLGLPKAYSYFLPRVELSQAKSLISKLTLIFFVLGAVFSIILFVGSTAIAKILNNPDLGEALRLFAIVPALLMPTMGIEGVLSTYRKNKFLAVYTILTRLLMLLCIALPVMIFDCGYMEAILGFVVASFITCFIALFLKYYPIRKEPQKKCDISCRVIFQFSLPLLFASFWGVIISSTDQFFISRYFGNEVFAEFSNGAMELPFVGMVVGACSTVLSPIFSRLSHGSFDPQKELLPLWKRAFEKAALIIYPILLYCIVFADVIMIILYGSQYEVSASYFRLKSFIDFFRVISYAPLIINIGKVRFYSNVHMYSAFLLVTIEYISVCIIPSPIVILLVSVLCTIGRIVYMLLFISKFFMIRFVDLFPCRIIIKLVFPPFILLLFIHFLFVEICSFNSFVTFIVSASLYFVFFAIYSLIVKIDYKSIIVQFLPFVHQQ